MLKAPSPTILFIVEQAMNIANRSPIPLRISENPQKNFPIDLAYITQCFFEANIEQCRVYPKIRKKIPIYLALIYIFFQVNIERFRRGRRPDVPQNAASFQKNTYSKPYTIKTRLRVIEISFFNLHTNLQLAKLYLHFLSVKQCPRQSYFVGIFEFASHGYSVSEPRHLNSERL